MHLHERAGKVIVNPLSRIAFRIMACQADADAKNALLFSAIQWTRARPCRRGPGAGLEKRRPCVRRQSVAERGEGRRKGPCGRCAV